MKHYRVTLEDTLLAHEQALRYGGADGVISIDAIESAIGRPYSGYHRRIHQKAAALLQAIVQNHGFVDANKRTALLVTDLLIRRSGYSLELSNDERIDDLIVSVAKGELSFDQIADWFSNRLMRRMEQ